MFQVQIPKDIQKYETKWIGPFNGRQCVCLLIALALGVPLYLIVSKDFGSQTGIIAVVPIIVFIFPFGWIKPYGLNFEQFLKVALVSNFIAPKNRLYKTQSLYEPFNTKLKSHKWKLKKKEYKNHPEYRAYK